MPRERPSVGCSCAMHSGFRFAAVAAAVIAFLAAGQTVATADMNESADRRYQAGMITGGDLRRLRDFGRWDRSLLGQRHARGVGRRRDRHARPERRPLDAGGARTAGEGGRFGFQHHLCALADGSVSAGVPTARVSSGTGPRPRRSRTPPRDPRCRSDSPRCRSPVGGLTHCAILVDGAVKCWGYDGGGEVGDGTVADPESNPTPGPPLPLGQPAKNIVLGDNHGCAILVDGSVSCWGLELRGAARGRDNRRAARGRRRRRHVALGQPAIAIAAGNRHTCVILADGERVVLGRRRTGAARRRRGAAPDAPTPPSRRWRSASPRERSRRATRTYASCSSTTA